MASQHLLVGLGLAGFVQQGHASAKMGQGEGNVEQRASG